ncbi:MAG: FtsQ-type POTRA domain-containing protein [Candidatus Pacebacteria bacterium]|nr:FtsQ-type POTRA domain-containing protein [Candidatus Paceibacterota bacterium]
MSSTPGILASRKRAKRKKLFLRLALLSFSAFSIIFAAAFFFFRAEKFRITEIKISGLENISEEEIRKEAESFLSANILKVFPANNFFLFSEKKTQDKFLAKFTRAVSVSVEKDYPSSLSINIEERSPVALFCEAGGKECFFADNTGYIFEKAPFFSAGVFLKFFDERTAENLSVGKTLLEREEFEKMIGFARRISNSVFPICEIHFVKDGVCEFWDEDGVKIIINEKDDFNLIFANLETAFSEIFEKEKKTAKDAEYIDLRFGNKVFFKWK